MKYILTAQGERYMARVNAEMIPMNLTRVQVGSGTAENPGELTELVDPKQKIQIDGREHDGTQAILHCMLTNVEVEEEYLLQQAGVFAYDPIDDQEYLVIIGQDEQGERVPPEVKRWLNGSSTSPGRSALPRRSPSTSASMILCAKVTCRSSWQDCGRW